jgi:hypothetical protein
MLLLTRRMPLALAAVCLSLSVSTSSALASGPATVTVRVEGLTETKLQPTTVTTTTAPVVNDGVLAHACSGTSALGALQLATDGNWSGPWNGGFNEYEIFSIEGESHPFEPGAPANYFWSLWLDEKESSVGACGAELQPGDRVLFFPSCFGKACPPEPSPLGIEAPASANVGESVAVTVKRYSAHGMASLAVGAKVEGGGVSATTDSSGRATLTFRAQGNATLKVTAPESIRTEATVCVHAGNDGNCGTQAPAAPTGPATPTARGGIAGFVASAPYTGPYAVVAQASGLVDGHVYGAGRSPRVLSGRVLAHTTVSSISLELRRSYKRHCYAYDGARARFLRARCGHGSLFKVASNGTFSYLLPSPLPPGRYVLDVRATDAAGNRTSLARGTSRIVFYVR